MKLLFILKLLIIIDNFNLIKCVLSNLFKYLILILNVNFLFFLIIFLKVYYQNYEFMSTVKLLDYNNYYGNTKILRYSIPDDVLLAIWRLQVFTPNNCPLVPFYL